MILAGCSATKVLVLLRRMDRKISGLKASAMGVRRERPAFGFQKIFLEFAFNAADAMDANVQKALHMAGETFCPVWQMVKNNVEVVTDNRISAS
ncbi:MAG: OsmC family protein [Deltaproteobacteria bacterium]|nr:OsmC family protein [Deltaproteobacteria bacterium]